VGLENMKGCSKKDCDKALDGEQRDDGSPYFVTIGPNNYFPIKSGQAFGDSQIIQAGNWFRLEHSVLA
jgi:hypothetical protein